MVTPYQKERCCLPAGDKTRSKLRKLCRIMGRSRTSKYYKEWMPQKDERLKGTTTSILGTSRLVRKKVIVKVKKKFPESGVAQIRRVYQRYGFLLYKSMKIRD